MSVIPIPPSPKIDRTRGGIMLVAPEILRELLLLPDTVEVATMEGGEELALLVSGEPLPKIVDGKPYPKVMATIENHGDGPKFGHFSVWYEDKSDWITLETPDDK